MTSKAEKDRAKLVHDKCQEILADLLRDDDNKYCVDCDAKGPRWASWNLGVFLCIRCAGIHRNLGVHISKVKSINLDSWTPEQVGSIQQMGNSKARAVYEANLPDGHRRPQTDSALDQFIRAKYEQRKYIAREWVAPTVTPAFDVEEEVKKDKDKRRQTNKPTATGIRGPSTVSSIISDQNNSVPRPVSTHPASTTISADKVPKDSPASLSGSKSNNDLLGINFADSALVGSVNNQSLKGNTGSASDGDLFAAFDGKSSNSAKDEESDFFNQKAPDMSKKLDTDSILKLYESSNISSSFFNQIPAMTAQQTHQQLPYGMPTMNAVQAPLQQQQPFGTFNQTPLVPSLMEPPTAQNGVLTGALTANPPSQLPSFGGPASLVTNPFLNTAPAPPPLPNPLTGFSMSQSATSAHKMNQQLGSLQLDTKLINNWLGTNLSSPASTVPPVPAVESSDPFSGLNGSLSKSNTTITEPFAPIPSANPFLTTMSSIASNNGSFGDNTFATFPTSFPTDMSTIAHPTATVSLPSQNQSDFSNLNWANFNQAPAILTGGPSLPPTSVLPPSTDLWQ